MSVFISRLGCSGIAIGTSSAHAFIRVSVSGIAASSFTPLSLLVVSLLLLYSPVPRLLCCSVEFGSCVLACIELTVWISCYWPTFFFCGTTSGTPTRHLHSASTSHLLSVSLSLSHSLHRLSHPFSSTPSSALNASRKCPNCQMPKSKMWMPSRAVWRNPKPRPRAGAHEEQW